MGAKVKTMEIEVSELQNNTPKYQVSCHTLPERTVGMSEWQTKSYFLGSLGEIYSLLTFGFQMYICRIFYFFCITLTYLAV
jgi:hypothetical protein